MGLITTLLYLHTGLEGLAGSFVMVTSRSSSGAGAETPGDRRGRRWLAGALLSLAGLGVFAIRQDPGTEFGRAVRSVAVKT